jgi:hypothetical protein
MKVTNNICTTICLDEDDLLIFSLKIHVMNYVKSLFINNIDKEDLDKVEITRSEKRTFLINLTKLRKSLGNVII